MLEILFHISIANLEVKNFEGGLKEEEERVQILVVKNLWIAPKISSQRKIDSRAPATPLPLLDSKPRPQITRAPLHWMHNGERINATMHNVQRAQ